MGGTPRLFSAWLMLFFFMLIFLALDDFTRMERTCFSMAMRPSLQPCTNSTWQSVAAGPDVELGVCGGVGGKVIGGQRLKSQHGKKKNKNQIRSLH